MPKELDIEKLYNRITSDKRYITNGELNKEGQRQLMALKNLDESQKKGIRYNLSGETFSITDSQGNAIDVEDKQRGLGLDESSFSLFNKDKKERRDLSRLLYNSQDYYKEPKEIKTTQELKKEEVKSPEPKIKTKEKEEPVVSLDDKEEEVEVPVIDQNILKEQQFLNKVYPGINLLENGISDEAFLKYRAQYHTDHPAVVAPVVKKAPVVVVKSNVEKAPVVKQEVKTEPKKTSIVENKKVEEAAKTTLKTENLKNIIPNLYQDKSGKIYQKNNNVLSTWENLGGNNLNFTKAKNQNVKDLTPVKIPSGFTYNPKNGYLKDKYGNEIAAIKLGDKEAFREHWKSKKEEETKTKEVKYKAYLEKKAAESRTYMEKIKTIKDIVDKKYDIAKAEKIKQEINAVVSPDVQATNKKIELIKKKYNIYKMGGKLMPKHDGGNNNLVGPPTKPNVLSEEEARNWEPPDTTLPEQNKTVKPKANFDIKLKPYSGPRIPAQIFSNTFALQQGLKLLKKPIRNIPVPKMQAAVVGSRNVRAATDIDSAMLNQASNAIGNLRSNYFGSDSNTAAVMNQLTAAQKLEKYNELTGKRADFRAGENARVAGEMEEARLGAVGDMNAQRDAQNKNRLMQYEADKITAESERKRAEDKATLLTNYFGNITKSLDDAATIRQQAKDLYSAQNYERAKDNLDSAQGYLEYESKYNPAGASDATKQKYQDALDLYNQSAGINADGTKKTFEQEYNEGAFKAPSPIGNFIKTAFPKLFK